MRALLAVYLLSCPCLATTVSFDLGLSPEDLPYFDALDRAPSDTSEYNTWPSAVDWQIQRPDGFFYSVVFFSDQFTGWNEPWNWPVTITGGHSYLDGCFDIYCSGTIIFSDVRLPPQTIYLTSDLNKDSFIDSVDAGILFGSWGTSDHDLWLDNIVDAADAGWLFSDWNSAADVPEPSSWLILAMCLLHPSKRRA